MISNIIIVSILCYSISGFAIGNVVLDKLTNNENAADEPFKMTLGELVSSIFCLLLIGGIISVICWLFDMFGICETMLPGNLKSKNKDYDAVNQEE